MGVRISEEDDTVSVVSASVPDFTRVALLDKSESKNLAESMAAIIKAVGKELSDGFTVSLQLKHQISYCYGMVHLYVPDQVLLWCPYMYQIRYCYGALICTRSGIAMVPLYVHVPDPVLSPNATSGEANALGIID